MNDRWFLDSYSQGHIVAVVKDSGHIRGVSLRPLCGELKFYDLYLRIAEPDTNLCANCLIIDLRNDNDNQ